MASNEKTAEYAITADPSGYEAGMARTIAASKEAHKQIGASFGAVGDMMGKLTGMMGGLMLAMAGGAVLKGAIADSNAWTGEAKKLSVQLGITTERASAMMVAMRHLGIDSEQVTNAAAKMSKQVFTNAAAFATLGVKVKDANGEYRPTTTLMAEVNDKLKEIKNPIAQNIAGNQVYGKSWGEVRGILKLTSEELEKGAVKARELGLVVGEEGVAQTRKYKESMNDMGLVMTSLEVQLGNAVLPVFVRLGSWLGNIGPVVAKAFGAVMESLGNIISMVGEIVMELWDVVSSAFQAIGEIISSVMGGDAPTAMEIFVNVLKVVEIAFAGLVVAVRLAVEFLVGLFETIGANVMLMASVAERALRWDWAGAKAAWISGTKNLETIAAKHADKLVEIASKGQEKINDILQRGPKKAAPESKRDISGGPNPNFDVAEKDKEKFKAQYALIKAKLEGEMAIQKEYLTEAQEAYTDAYQHNLVTTDQFYAAKSQIEQQGFKSSISIKEEEVRQIQALELKAKASGKASDVLGLKAQELKVTAELTVLNAQAFNAEIKNARELSNALQQKKNAMLEIERVSQQQAGSAQIDRERIMIGQAVALHEMSDAQAIQAEIALQNRLYAINLQAMQAKADQFDGNREKIAQNNADIEQLERDHQTRMLHLKSEALVEENRDRVAATDTIKSGFENSIAGMLQGTMTLKQGLQGVWTSVLQAFSQFIAKKVVMWAMGETVQTAATVAGNTTRVASGWWAAAQSVMASAWSAIKTIAIKAWEVAASVYSAIAGIPYVGPFLAPVMAVAAGAAVIGFAGHIASAEGGYDIPAGVNPITQLHEREMVLPAEQADAVRDMAGGGGGGGGNLNVTLSGTPMKGGFFMAHQDELLRVMKTIHRNGQR
jgi:hypothetical protein